MKNLYKNVKRFFRPEIAPIKYILRKNLPAPLSISGAILYRIERLSDGKLGGYVQSEENLSHEGDCWIDDNAEVSGNARVSGNAQVYGNAHVHGDERVHGDTYVSGNSHVCGYAVITSAEDILNYTIPSHHSVTITPDNITIGCETKKRHEWLKVTKEEAVRLGLKEDMYDKYRALIKAGLKIVPKRKK